VPEDDIRSGGFVKDTEQAALWCLGNTSTYEDCVLLAVNLGDDTDTTAAVAGGLAGIAYGMDAIPAKWMDALLGKDVIEGCLF
ncbi:MAG: ADP-ribosylglycohydrolase family protein, partial [Coriobacteriales bacterium]